jgi:uncharacterized Tic20 family protein/DNA-binding Xre family transcriptional regulator
MNQPDIGLKVAELRQQKALTQEQLAEQCEVSARTIQRIESGEVEPRAFTRNNLSHILEFDLGEDNTQNESLWLAALHLSSAFCILIIPLLIWSWKKNQSYKIDKHGRDVLNFQITMTLVLFAAVIFLIVLLPGAIILINEFGNGINAVGNNLTIVGILPFIAILPLIGTGIFCFYQGVANTTRVLSDKPYKYPLSIHFVK